MWSLYNEEKFLEPLKFSNGKTQEDVVREIIDSAKSGKKIIIEDWQKKIGSVDISLTKICDCLDKHDDSSDERGRFVREEHKEMIEVLKRINGYRDGK